MFSFKSIVLIAVALARNMECHEVAVPAVAAPLTVPAHVGYAHGIPQNIPPHGSQVNYFNRAITAPFAPVTAPLAAPVAPVATPLAAPIAPFGAPFAAPYAARFEAGPYTAGPSPYLTGPVSFGAAPYAAPGVAASAAYTVPFPYSGAFLRTPFGVTPAFVR